MLIKGIDVSLYVMASSTVNSLGELIKTYAATPVTVSNVLVEPVSNDGSPEENELSGKHTVYNIHIPKGDTHTWTDTIVEFYGKKWKTIGMPTVYHEHLTPLSWNKKIKVELYE